MKFTTRLFLLALSVALVSLAAQAQNGCVTSPENPTAVLGLVGIAGAAWPLLRARLRNKR